jgi:hypothetical protein
MKKLNTLPKTNKFIAREHNFTPSKGFKLHENCVAKLELVGFFSNSLCCFKWLTVLNSYQLTSKILKNMHSTIGPDRQKIIGLISVINPTCITHSLMELSHQLCSYSRTSQHFMEPESSLPCSQKPCTGPHPEPDQSNTYHPISADKGWSSSLGVGLTTPHCKKQAWYENSQEASDLDGFLG